MLHNIGNFLAYYGSLSAVIGALLLPVNWLVTTKYFNKKPKIKKIYNPFSHIYLIFAATMQYALLITFKGGAKKSIYKKIYSNINFRDESRPIDKLLSYTFVVLFIGGMILMCIALIFLGLAKVI